jgi:hypothetical protein
LARHRIRKDECALLSRADARVYVGGLGDERFDREVGPHVTVRMIGKERFYKRRELDAWVDGHHIGGHDLADEINRHYAARRAGHAGG